MKIYKRIKNINILKKGENIEILSKKLHTIPLMIIVQNKNKEFEEGDLIYYSHCYHEM